ncbi:MAG: hypothetical protein C0625_06300 [Arcobacter sp.]|nr:MAG: hypothetical protein C0625_06300 [Arcobacter sp.]
MSSLEKTEIENIHLALVSTDLELLNELSNSSSMNTRRALARNRNINSIIANKLLFDPVLNVSYIASLNSRRTLNRNFDENIITPCVRCNVDERKLNCMACPDVLS